MSWLKVILLVFVGFTQYAFGSRPNRERGALIGQIRTLQHNVSGTVWAVDEDMLFIEDFTYDGLGPDAFFWIGDDVQPSPRGHLIRYPLTNTDEKPAVLPRMDREDIILHLPHGMKITEMKWLSIWCRRFTVDFGHVYINSDLDPPRQRTLPEFQRLAHGLRSGNITILDAKTFYIPNLHYDGRGPDAYFWVGKGPKPDPKGHKIPNEMGSLDVLRAYEGEDIELQLPDNLTVYDIDYLGVWCVTYKHNFGHVQIPRADELWVPPALGQTRIKPRWWYEAEPGQAHFVSSDFENCRQLSDDLQVEWQAKEEEVHIRLTARMKDDQYIAFGISPVTGKPEIVNSDIVVAYYDSDDGSFHAIDYTVTSKSQCDGTYGVCPDERVSGRNDASVIGGERKNGITSITFSRPYETKDQLDMSISRFSEHITVVAAIGQLNRRKEAIYHENYITKDTVIIDFLSERDYSCSTMESVGHEPTRHPPWQPNEIRATTNFTATIGPTGGDRGYGALAKTPSWRIVWWINDKLIPEIYVERGQTYYFEVKGGDDPLSVARYHPLYITDSPEGGFGQKTVEEQEKERVFAGVKKTKMGMWEPTAVGGLCEWQHEGVDAWEDSLTFEEYKETLYKACDGNMPGSLVWTVDEFTPDLVYYQCYTHRDMGWKIHVVDSGYKLRREGDNGGSDLLQSHFLLSVEALILLPTWRLLLR